MAARRARVTAAYATVRIMDPATGAPSVRGFYQGAVFPDVAFAEDVERLVRREYAEWADEAAPAVVEEPVSGEAGDETQHLDRPADNANKAAWVDYAVACRDEGVSDEDARATAEGMTKAELISLHG
jgi:hypothetical protein